MTKSAMQKHTKTNSSTSSEAVNCPILRKSVAGIEFILNEDDFIDEEDLGRAAKMSKNVRDLAGSMRFKINNMIKNYRKLSLQEMTFLVMNDQKLWKEFLKELADLKIVTNFGAKEVLINFIAEREKEIIEAYGDSMKAAAQEQDESKEYKVPSEAIGNVIQSAINSASSVKERIQRRACMTFNKRSPSGYLLSSDASRYISDMSHKVRFDLGSLFTNTVEEKSRNPFRMFAGDSRRNDSVGEHKSSLVETSHYSEIKPKILVENELPYRKLSLGHEPSLSQKYNENITKKDSVKKEDNFLLSSVSNNPEEHRLHHGSELIESWENTNRGCNFIETKQGKGIQVRTNILISKSASLLEKSISMDGLSSKMVYEKDSLFKLIRPVKGKDAQIETNNSISTKATLLRKSISVDGSLSKLFNTKDSNSNLIKKKGEDIKKEVSLSSSTKTFLLRKSIEMDGSSSKNIDARDSISSLQNEDHKRRSDDVRFHIVKQYDACKSKNTPTNIIYAMQSSTELEASRRLAHSTQFMLTTEHAVDCMQRKQNDGQLTESLKLCQPKKPMELLTLYLD